MALHLRHADAEDLARRACRARPDADEDAGRALVHELVGRLAAHRVADEDGQLQAAGQVGQGEHARRGRDVAGAAHLGLDEEEVGAGLGGQLGVMPGRCRRGGHRGDCAPWALMRAISAVMSSSRTGCSYASASTCAAAWPDSAAATRSMIGAGVLVAGVEALEVDEGHAAVAAHADREVGIGHGIHGRREERDLERGIRRARCARSTSAGSAVTAPGTSATSSNP